MHQTIILKAAVKYKVGLRKIHQQLRGKVIRIQQKYTDDIRKVLTGSKPGGCLDAIKYLVDAAQEVNAPGVDSK